MLGISYILCNDSFDFFVKLHLKSIQFNNKLKGNIYKGIPLLSAKPTTECRSHFHLKKGSEWEMEHSKVQEYPIVIGDWNNHQNWRHLLVQCSYPQDMMSDILFSFEFQTIFASRRER